MQDLPLLGISANDPLAAEGYGGLLDQGSSVRRLPAHDNGPVGRREFSDIEQYGDGDAIEARDANDARAIDFRPRIGGWHS
jgi:hypothetical protein